MAIIGILVSLLLPAVQACREVARRTSCLNNVRQIILAIHSHEFAQEHFPAGVTNDSGPVRNVPEGNHMSWIARILPELDESARFRAMDFSVGAYHQRNNAVRQSIIPLLVCPSFAGVDAPVSSYAGVHHHTEAPIDADNTGVLFLNSHVTFEDIVDGTSYTLVVGEKLVDGAHDLGWMSGTAATLRNPGPLTPAATPVPAPGAAPWDVRPTWYGIKPPDADDAPPAGPFITHGGDPSAPLAVGSFDSFHPGGAVFALADGSCRFGAGSGSPAAMQQLANRKDGALPEPGY
jgi:hypothetical protein